MDNKTSSGHRPALQYVGPISLALLVIDFLLFASGGIAHLGIPIPLGFTTWSETFLVPAVVVEGVGALALGTALISLGAGMARSRQLAWWAL